MTTTLTTAAAATPHPAAAAAARDMLLRGGNAIDAAVAAVLTCCVAEPAMVGLGGYGGSLVAHLATPSGSPPGVFAIDFDSRAPLAYRPEAYPNGRADYDTGYRSITVPGVVAGLDLALSRFGTLPWGTVCEPAAVLAETGLPVTPGLKRQLDGWAAKAESASRKALFATGRVPAVGESWVQGDLARLLRRLIADGPAAFYRGEIPRTIVRQVRGHGGLLSEEDFARYRPTIVEPLAIAYRGYRVVTPPPPSGGVTTLQILRTLKQFDIAAMPRFGAEYFHVIAESARQAWRDRSASLGDPDFAPIPVDRLPSRGAAPPDQPHTVNVVAADAAGNIVSVTATLGYLFGSAVVIDGLGLIMNHGMSRFDLTPGSPNAPAAGKRMAHNMAPTVVLGRDDRPFAAVGLPGGPKIITVTAQLVSSLVDFGATPADAVRAGRIHAESDGPIAVSSAVPDSVIDQLRAKGHAVRRGQDVGGPPDEIGGPANVLAIDPRTGAASAASQAGADAAVTISTG